MKTTPIDPALLCEKYTEGYDVIDGRGWHCGKVLRGREGSTLIVRMGRRGVCEYVFAPTYSMDTVLAAAARVHGLFLASEE